MVVLSTRPVGRLSSPPSISQAPGRTYLGAFGSIGPLPNWNSYRCSSPQPKASKMAWCRSSRVWSPRIWMVRDTPGFFLANFIGDRAAEPEDLQGVETHFTLAGGLADFLCWLFRPCHRRSPSGPCCDLTWESPPRPCGLVCRPDPLDLGVTIAEGAVPLRQGALG